MNAVRLIGVVVLAIAAAALGAAGYLWLAPAAKVPAPAVSLVDLDGREHQLADYRGQVLVVNFWATWCAPCLREIPMLVEAQNELGGQGLQIIGPALDDPTAVRRFAEAHAMNYPIFAGADQVGPALVRLGDQRGALPYTLVIDREGHFAAQHYGELDRKGFYALIRPFL